MGKSLEFLTLAMTSGKRTWVGLVCVCPSVLSGLAWDHAQVALYARSTALNFITIRTGAPPSCYDLRSWSTRDPAIPSIHRPTCIHTSIHPSIFRPHRSSALARCARPTAKDDWDAVCREGSSLAEAETYGLGYNVMDWSVFDSIKHTELIGLGSGR